MGWIEIVCMLNEEGVMMVCGKMWFLNGVC